MDITRKCSYIANAYYNKALKLAGERDLTGSALCLKNALKFNKRHADARNLLGLIYYEQGEIADALVQWVISINMKPMENDADRYLADIQRNPSIQESYNQAIEKFNQALSLAQGGSSDEMAVKQLEKITTQHPGYVRAQLLLALMDMRLEKYSKAAKALQAVLKIDRANPTGLRYSMYLRQLRPVTDKRRRPNSTEQAKESQGTSDVITPTAYRETSGIQTVVNILLGFVIGAALVTFVYVPAKKDSILAQYNQRVIESDELVSKTNNQYKELYDQYQAVVENNSLIQSQAEEKVNAATQKLLQYQKLAALAAMDLTENLPEAVRLYASIDPDQIVTIEDEGGTDARAMYDSIKNYMETEAYVLLYRQGDGEYDSSNYEQAKEYYDLSIAAYPENPIAIYKKGLALTHLDARDEANELFTKVIENWPQSQAAPLAKAERGY